MALLLTISPQTSARTDDVVIVARRIREMHLILGRDPQGRITCGLDRSSGNTVIDQKMCRIARPCMKNRSATPAQVRACVETRKPRLIAQLQKRPSAEQRK